MAMTRYTAEGGRTGGGWVGQVGAMVVAVLVIIGAARTASAETAVPVITTRHWKLDVKPDAAALVAGRDAYEEYVFIEDDQITAFELARLGFGPILPSLGMDATGAITFTVNLTSRTQGSVSISGKMTATTMSGTVKWTKDGKVYNYTFNGVPYTPAADVES